MLETEFLYEGSTAVIQCHENDKMLDICYKFCVKINKEIGDIVFLYKGEKVNFGKQYKDMISNQNGSNSNRLIILANNSTINNNVNTIVNSKQVICPKCEEKSIRFKLRNYHISLFGCDNKHEFLEINTEEYLKTQKVDLSKIICDKCQSQNKSDSYNNKFYKCCQCKQLLCPLCRNSHDKSHPIINYDDKCFICEEHGQYYTKYCNQCKTNLCLMCEDDHKHHNLIYFSDIMPNKEAVVDSIKELEAKINKFKEELENIKKLFDNLIKNLKVYYEILKKIADEYDDNNDRKKNYQILQNMNDFKNFSSSIIFDINKIINNDNLKSKMINIVEMYYKILPNNDFDIVYENNEKQKTIKIFGEEFVKNNKNKNCKIEYEGEDIELQENLKVKNLDQNLVKIKLKNIKNITNMKHMFFGCTSLKSVLKISLINTGKVTNMSGMFFGCSSLKELDDISGFDTFNVTNIGGMFGKCSSLIEIPDISKWDTSNIIYMNGLFGQCSSLKKLPDISKWDTNKVINMEKLFCNCSSLVELPDISEWDVSNVTDFSKIFQNCSSLRKLPDISKWNPNNLKKIEYMFDSCESLIEIPDISKWNTSNVTSLCMMFNYCLSLKELPDISKWDVSNVTNINSMLQSCLSLKSLPDISKWNVSKVSDAKDYFKNCKLKKPKLKFKSFFM